MWKRLSKYIVFISTKQKRKVELLLHASLYSYYLAQMMIKLVIRQAIIAPGTTAETKDKICCANGKCEIVEALENCGD